MSTIEVDMCIIPFRFYVKVVIGIALLSVLAIGACGFDSTEALEKQAASGDLKAKGQLEVREMLSQASPECEAFARTRLNNYSDCQHWQERKTLTERVGALEQQVGELQSQVAELSAEGRR